MVHEVGGEPRKESGVPEAKKKKMFQKRGNDQVYPLQLSEVR